MAGGLAESSILRRPEGFQLGCRGNPPPSGHFEGFLDWVVMYRTRGSEVKEDPLCDRGWGWPPQGYGGVNRIPSGMASWGLP